MLCTFVQDKVLCNPCNKVMDTNVILITNHYSGKGHSTRPQTFSSFDLYLYIYIHIYI